MKAFTKDQLATRDALVKKLRDCADDVRRKETIFADEIASYNLLIAEANAFVSDIAEQVEDFIDAKSDEWQEGEKGQKYVEWKDTLEGFELEPIPTFDLLTLDDAEALEELQTELGD